MPAVLTPEPLLGSHAHGFNLKGTDGRAWTLEDVRGPSGLLVMFICNHCPYVKAIRSRLVYDVAELKAAGIGVVAINSNDAERYPEDSPQKMAEVAREFGFDFPYLYDDTQAVARAYGAVCTPDFFGYNADLELQYRGRLDSAQIAERGPEHRRELVEAMLEVVATGEGPIEQHPSMGCSIKWKPH